MSEPAVFALVRDGEKRYYADRWASATLRREVMWGPEDFEAWVEQFEQLDEWEDCCSGGAIVDFDKRELLWTGETLGFDVPRIWQTHTKLVEAAWPNFTVKAASKGVEDLATYLGLPLNEERVEEDEDEDEYELRPLTVKDARRDDPEDEDDEPEDEDDSLRAWVTIIDEDGTARQRQLSALSLDLLKGEASAIDAVAKLPPDEIPQEALVSEGLLLNPSRRTARIWGSSELLTKMKHLGKLWKGWQLKWTKRGYAEQSAASGTRGLPMSDVDVLAKILPVVLSTEQINVGAFMDAIGGGVKKFAKKATGCLIFVLCIPLVLFGVFSGNWTAVLYSIAATVVIIVGLYMLIARRFRKAVQKNLPQTAEDETTTVVAGPLEEDARKARINQLLVKAEMPKLEEVEPHFPEASGLELLAS